MNIHFVDFAIEEVDQAAAFYDEQQSGLGSDFRDEVNKVIDRIVEDPSGLPEFSRNSRICRTSRFPYGVIFQIRDDKIRIVAVMHLHRNPDYWKDRTQD